MTALSVVVIAASLAVFSSSPIVGEQPVSDLLSNGTDHNDSCIILIGELTYFDDERDNAHASYGYYHPDADVDCDVKQPPLWWSDNINLEFELTCSLSATNEIVTIDSDHDSRVGWEGRTPAAVYSLKHRTVRYLPETDEEYENATRNINFITSAGVSQCIACSRWYFDDNDRALTPVKCWKYDARETQPIWQLIPSVPEWPIVGGIGVWLTDNDLYVINQADTMPVAPEDEGKEIEYKPGDLNTLHRYDIRTGRMHQLETAPGLRYDGYAATALSSTELLLCGGNGETDDQRDCWIYDTTPGRWHATGSMNVGRSRHSLVTFNGEVYTIGGWSNGTSPLLSVERYNRTSDTWMLVKPLEEAKQGFLAVVV